MDATPSNATQTQPDDTTSTAPTTSASVEVAATSKPADDTISKAAHEAALEKARQQEKTKLYKKMEQEKLAREQVEAKLKQGHDEMAALREELDQLKSKDLSEIQKVQRQLEKQAQANEDLKKQLEEVATVAAERVTRSEQKAYRAQAIAKAGLELTELVPEYGTSEEIDNAIARAKERETAITAKARTEAEERVRQEQAEQVPRPISPAGGTDRRSVLASMDRKEIAKIRDPGKYREVRSKLLAEARERAGI